jgi:hypothetical protein
MTPTKHATVSVVIPKRMRQELHKIAEDEGRSLSGHVRWLIAKDLERRRSGSAT